MIGIKNIRTHPFIQNKLVFLENSTANFKYYSNYSSYRMPTTIQLSTETKNLIGSFGTKEDTYEDIIKRMYKLAVKEQLNEFLMSSDKTITLEEARKRHAKRW